MNRLKIPLTHSRHSMTQKFSDNLNRPGIVRSFKWKERIIRGQSKDKKVDHQTPPNALISSQQTARQHHEILFYRFALDIISDNKMNPRWLSRCWRPDCEPTQKRKWSTIIISLFIIHSSLLFSNHPYHCLIIRTFAIYVVNHIIIHK